ncbi:unnamed protein product [Rhizoctonia solani]|uniref:Uncharacterized protein n=1 Tax=Rhizoctonia solani TaxID=456999 RepID=A0A8H3HR20_9AGAM|nr:unnamed protein product [Rhizoctonia solani]
MQDLKLVLGDLSSCLETLSTLNGGEPLLELDEESTAVLNPWKESALRILDKLKDILKVYGTNLDVAERARVISLTAVFIGQDHFTDESCRNAAKDCLNRIGALDKTIAARVLNDHVKPLFQVSVHPGIHLDTGRVKHDAISIQNMYDEQPWKIKGAGCWNILVWVLSNMDSSDIETLWPLAIPPLLTLLDDFKPMYKLRGVDVTQALLKKAPPTLLRRTGVGELLFKSLLGALQNLTSDSAPELLRETTPCYLVLVDLVLPDDDLQRYAKLAELVTDVIIPGWLYASSRIEIMIESVYALSLVVQALGAGSIRFLKAIIPQLTENLSPKEFSQTHTIRRLQIESAKCLLIVMVNARPRIPYWRVRILDGLLRCWVDVNEDTSDGMELEREELKECLISAFRELLATSQSLLEAFLSKNAKLYMVGRQSDRAQMALASLCTIKKGELKFIEMDLTSLDSTRTAAQEFLRSSTYWSTMREVLYPVIPNILLMSIHTRCSAEFLPPIDLLTNEGYDLVFGVNCVATCFFTLCLLPCLLKTPSARIVNMASEVHRWVDHIDYSSVMEGEKRRGMDPFVNYGQSKLGLMLFSNELHRRYHRFGLVSVSLHPGTIKTNCYKHKPAWLQFLLHLFMYSPEMGAITPLWAATTASDLGGWYLLPWARVAQCESWAEDVDEMKKLWSWVIDRTEEFNSNIARFREE